MIAFVLSVLRLLAFEDDGWRAAPRLRPIEISDIVEALAANACAVLLLAGTMTGLASVFVHLIRLAQAHGALQ